MRATLPQVGIADGTLKKHGFAYWCTVCGCNVYADRNYYKPKPSMQIECSTFHLTYSIDYFAYVCTTNSKINSNINFKPNE